MISYTVFTPPDKIYYNDQLITKYTQSNKQNILVINTEDIELDLFNQILKILKFFNIEIDENKETMIKDHNLANYKSSSSL